MTISTPHLFLGENHAANQRKTRAVLALTAAMMVVEIAGGVILKSMALTADGLHMATHAGVMLIAWTAYAYANAHRQDPRFVFGTAKLGDLAGFVSALALGLIAVLIAYESIVRLFHPAPTAYGEAMALAGLGFLVNAASAFLLHAHHDGNHSHGATDNKSDNNFRAAYVHVLADMGVSALAVVALGLGKYAGIGWMDPAAGLVGAAVIFNWAMVLVKTTSCVLLDVCPDATLASEVQAALVTAGATVTDFHLWRVGPGHYSVVASLKSETSRALSDYKACLARFDQLAHITIEIA